MKQRRLGPGGPEVSGIGLGGMYMSIRGRPDESQAIETITAALDAGVTFIDTADVYCLDDDDLGHNERLIQKALASAGRPKDVLVATKGGLGRPGGAWAARARPEQLTHACERSLKALGVECIDLYQLHAPDPEVPLADSMGAMLRLVEAGKVRRVGLSNVSVSEIEQAREIVPIASVQNRWNPSHRDPEHDGVLSHCEKLGIAFLPYSPFGGARGARSLFQVGTLSKRAKAHGMSVHRLVLAWMLEKSPVVLPIPGARRSASIVDSAAAADVRLTAGDVTAIEASIAPD